jgi:hypothetical protein
MLKICLRFMTLFASLAIICTAARFAGAHTGTGAEWLSWSAAQRATYVNGYISGYLDATHSACDAADELFEVDKRHSLGDAHHPSEYPSARCFARADSYSKFGSTGDKEMDFAAYTSVVTEFYNKYPKCSGIYYDQILKLLNDRSYKTADQIYEMTKVGTLHEIR